MQLFVENAPECLGEGAKLHLHAGKGGQAPLLRQMCVHVLWEGKGEGCQLFHPIDLARLHRVIPTLPRLDLVVNRI